MFATGCFFRRSVSHAIKPPQAQLSNQHRAVANGQLWSPWKLSVSVFFPQDCYLIPSCKMLFQEITKCTVGILTLELIYYPHTEQVMFLFPFIA